MSDLAATNCGCNNDCGCGCNNGCGCGNDCGCGNGTSLFGGSSCNCILWIIILMCCCGNNGCGNGCGCGNNDNCWIIVVLLLLCGNNGFGCGNGCGGCGCWTRPFQQTTVCRQKAEDHFLCLCLFLSARRSFSLCIFSLLCLRHSRSSS